MKELKIYYTSDTHGWLYPQGEGSLLQCVEAFAPDGNSLVLDGGDSIQGSPLAKYLHGIGKAGEVLAYGFQLGRYDYYTLGNHDFNYGYEGLAQFVEHMTATCLCANVKDPSGRLDIQPYVIHSLENGLRVGITGAVTDFVNFWEAQERIAPLVVSDCFTALEEALSAMKGHCDLSICLYHGGFEEDLDSGERIFHSRENIGGEICRKLDFDVLLSAHQHKEIPGRYYHGTYVIQPPVQGGGFAQLQLQYMEPILPHSAPFLGIESQFCPPSDSISEKMLQFFFPIFRRGQAWLNQELCELPEKFSTGEKLSQAMEGCKLADFLNFVQLSVTGAEISSCSMPNGELSLPKSLTVGSVLQAYPYANKLVVLEVSGEILYRTLKQNASYFRWSGESIQVDSRFLQPKKLHYFYEYFAQVHYEVKLSPFGENQLENVLVAGEALDLQRKYRLAVSEFRASGVGGYEFLRDCPVLKVIEKDIQDLMLDFFQEDGDVSQVPSYHSMEFHAPKQKE